MSAPDATQLVEMLNSIKSGYDHLLELRFTSATAEAVVAELEVGPQHCQVYGIVHGGVYASITETLCSTGAGLHATMTGAKVVGLDNHTSFLRATRGGRLTGVAKPIKLGRRVQLWQADIHDDEERLVATGQVRLFVVEQGATVGDEELGELRAGPQGDAEE